jgi:arabinan endo-1,5-alpha-L-arabinosidase
MVNHGKDISATIKPSQAIRLEANGAVGGAATGTWVHKGANHIGIVLDGGESFNGVLSRQWNPNANAFAVTFSAQSKEGVSLWGIRTGA